MLCSVLTRVFEAQPANPVELLNELVEDYMAGHNSAYKPASQHAADPKKGNAEKFAKKLTESDFKKLLTLVKPPKV